MNRIRTLFYTAFFVSMTLVASILALPLLLFGERATRGAVKVWVWLALAGLRAICSVRFRLEGREFIPTQGALVAVNHQSMWETIALFGVLERPILVLKKELARIPVYGWWAMRLGNIPVDRSGGGRAARAMMRAAREKIDAGYQVVLFPQGTRARPSDPMKLQPGVAGVYATAGRKCTPAVHDSGRYWLHPGGLTSLKVPGTVTLRFLPPIEAGLDRKSFMAALTERLSAAPTEACTQDAPSSVDRYEGATA